MGEGSTSSGLNSGSSANRSSKSTSDKTLLSTESKVFFKGGGRSLGFFTGPSFLSEASGSGPPADLPASPGEPPILLDAGGGTGEDGGGGAGAAGEGSKRLSGTVPFQSIEYTDSFLMVGDGGSLLMSDSPTTPPCIGDPTAFSSVADFAHTSRDERSSAAVSLGFPAAKSRGGAAGKALDEEDDSVVGSRPMDAPRGSAVYFGSGVSSQGGSGAGREVERPQGEGDVASYDPTGILAMVAFTF